MMNAKSKISALKGIGDKTEALFRKLDIRTIGEVIRYYPRTFEIFEEPVLISELEEGRTAAVSGTVFGPIQVSSGKTLQVTSLYLKDMTGTLKVIWFRMPYLRKTLGRGGLLVLRGRVVRRKDGILMEHPEIYYPASKYGEKLNTMQPVYPLTAGLSNNTVIKTVRQALDYVSEDQDILPASIRERFHFMPFVKAISHMHFPQDKESFREARARFVFEEFLVFLVSLRQLKNTDEQAENIYRMTDTDAAEHFMKTLPFQLTGAQIRVWDEIRRDMQGSRVMSRLVQGDVGSGKTIVALLGLILAGTNGYQGALMAPTEVLARQHYETITGLLSAGGISLRTELLTGSMTEAGKREARLRIESGEASIIIGTHALIQEKVVYKNLALVVTDEQHRFGVRQRETLAGKGNMPHILVMSATPIPRTLAIILYGDLDVSVIDEMPRDRLPIKNCVVGTEYRGKAYSFMKKQVEAGRQCYVICPMVEESERLDAENVTDYSRMLEEELGSGIRVGCLHGKMKPREKDKIMDEFARNQIQILVSTTVVEVGIDVPNASVIMIENSERFGLAQLHQLRGRVGRGRHQSYCIFMTSSRSDDTKERLEILNRSNDGFYIAGEDLRLRGPGDLFGIRQSGILDFKLADIFQDAGMLTKAAEAAEELLRADPCLEDPENRKLKEYIDHKIREIMLESTL